MAEVRKDSSLALLLLCGRRISIAKEECCSTGLRRVAVGPKVSSGLIIESHRDKLLVILIR